MAVLALLYCAGCGLVGDAATHVQAVQLPPGKLLSSEFYQTATPAAVEKKIGGKSLADEIYVYKSVDRARPVTFVGGLVEGFTFPFVSYNYVKRSAVDPLMVASFSTPYPEVMLLLLEAGAGQHMERENPGHIQNWLKVFLRRHSDEKSFSLLLPYLSEDSCERFIHFFGEIGGTKLSAFDDYLAFFPDTDLNCRGKNGMTPLESTMAAYSEEQFEWLLSKGANPECPLSNGKTPLARAATRQEHMTGLLLEYGAKIDSLTKEERQDLRKALNGQLRSSVSTAEWDKLDEWLEKAIRTGNPRMMQELGALCSLPSQEKSARLKKILD